MGKIKLITDNERTIDKAFEEFEKSNTIRGLAEDTKTSYRATYRAITEYYNEENLCSNLNVDIIEGFICYLRENREVNNISINSHLTNVRAFVNYCIRLGYVEEFKIQSVKAEKQIKETYTDSELTILLKKPNLKKCSFVEYRNWVFINYLMATRKQS